MAHKNSINSKTFQSMMQKNSTLSGSIKLVTNDSYYFIKLTVF